MKLVRIKENNIDIHGDVRETNISKSKTQIASVFHKELHDGDLTVCGDVHGDVQLRFRDLIELDFPDWGGGPIWSQCR